ncbi:hypothetical protein KXW28_007793 [Aspergillus fumigatus]|uniref:chitinase n=1 Tax=Aspergillus fumigatus TaxID=746128 RepID=A0A9P8NDQ6_ASPFM|nr:hypothetical protein KXX45_005492 [Aspergillus fumigatus]KAH1290908.1 hypothetical protein KXX48_007631 [Aspergillus fumigatus]KAH1293104.1 hypothetical protein KXX30_004306 [Aspergillus fumigatus]KAH1329777.1 hypothetical protein KXX38_001970 [Aspergillus fumigatus]KAH1330431.1 hypothetical protein KXX47_005780 [Aspergillus fumigatus]
MLKSLVFSLMAVQAAMGSRFAMYIDQYHTVDLPGSDQTQGVTHAIMAFAPSKQFNSDSSFTPFDTVNNMRKRFAPDTKVMIAIGGWGDTAGFSEGAKDEASRTKYAKNVATMINNLGFDGVDIDWEYPGGNGDDYKKVPNSQKTSEIETYPLFVQAIRDAIGKDKILSVAVPGKRGDMIAFTKEQGPKIWSAVDMVNVMSYDLMNRRDNVTNHHSGVAGSLDTIKAYKEIGLDTAKMNLGFAYYAKWFMTDPNSDCAQQPIGCAVVPLENPDGSDPGKSGTLTFEKSTMAAPPDNLRTSTDGTCGYSKGTKCPSGSCCSQYGNCGTGDDFCQAGCLSDYGECKGISVTDSWRRALKDGKTDEEAGGQYYWDSTVNLFWTWDTPAIIDRKFKDIVNAEKLGGIMAWSLGEDTLNWEHLKAMQKGLGKYKYLNDAETSTPPRVAQSSLRGTGPQGEQHGVFIFLSSTTRAAAMRLVYLLLPLSLGLPITIPVDGTEKNTTNQSTDKILQAYLHTLHTSHFCAHTLSQYAPELLALALFSLLPLALCILALSERIARSWTVEAYPERGRSRRRFLGRERRCLMQARREREKRAALERVWWIAEREHKIMKMLAVAARFVFVVSTREKLCAVLMRLAVTLGVRAVLRRLTELLTWEKLIVW